MYKIVLADDEGIVLESLNFIIKKEFGEECSVESVKTGRALIELAEQSRPDIAIVDIQMPGINGIEAIRQIQQRNPQMIFIIITAYDKFSYAKEAVSLGVFDFLNKPINRTEFIRVLRAAMEKISKERMKRSRELEIQEKLEVVVPIIENGLVYNILFQENSRERIDSYKEILEINEDYGYMAVLVCGEEQHDGQMTNMVGSGVRLQRIYSNIRVQLKGHLNCYVGAAMSNKIIMFFPYDRERMEYQDRIELIEKSRQMIRNMNQEYEARFRLGIGSVCQLHELQHSYSEALEALNLNDSSVVHADDVPLRAGYEDNYPLETERKLMGGIENKDMNQVINSANQFFDWMESTYPEDIDNIKLKVIEFVLWAEHLVHLQGGGVYRFSSRKSYLSSVLALQELSSIRNWFLQKMQEACRTAQNQKEEQSDNVVSRARKYIGEHYSDRDISLDEVSRSVDISPYYFSKLFKEETGSNFIDYLTTVRMEKAKELLLSSDLSMKEIAGEVGYADPNYFSRAFKKNVGLTPTEYKEEQR